MMVCGRYSTDPQEATTTTIAFIHFIYWWWKEPKATNTDEMHGQNSEYNNIHHKRIVLKIITIVYRCQFNWLLTNVAQPWVNDRYSTCERCEGCGHRGSTINLRLYKMEIQLKRKRVSKKTKKAWRKHSDIRDVENFLDDVRLQERTG